MLAAKEEGKSKFLPQRHKDTEFHRGKTVVSGQWPVISEKRQLTTDHCFVPSVSLWLIFLLRLNPCCSALKKSKMLDLLRYLCEIMS
jgi:hypothetical protein